MPKTVDDLLPAKPSGRLRIYAYSIADEAHAGLLKIGQTNDLSMRCEKLHATPSAVTRVLCLVNNDQGVTQGDVELHMRTLRKQFCGIGGKEIEGRAPLLHE